MKTFPYNTHLDIKYQHFETIDVKKLTDDCNEWWYNQTLTKVNDSVVRLGIIEGEYHWHMHDDDDEFFFVLEGQLLIDLEDRTITLTHLQGCTISKGTMHRPRAPIKTVILMVETSNILPTGSQTK